MKNQQSKKVYYPLFFENQHSAAFSGNTKYHQRFKHHAWDKPISLTGREYHKEELMQVGKKEALIQNPYYEEKYFSKEQPA